MKASWPVSLAIALFLGLTSAPDASADRININMTNLTATGTDADGTGVLGGGTWNRIAIADHVGANPLVKSNGAATTITQTAADAPSGLDSGNGNPVQSESWGLLGTWSLTFSGLLPNQIYKLAIYGARTLPNTYTVNGVSKSFAAAAGPAVTVLPGTEGADYLIIVANSTAAGQLVIDVAGIVAGVQIEGLLDGTESGPQIDCRIKKNAAGEGGKGDGLYSINTARSQSVRQKTIGRRGKRYYVNIENDGEEIDSCYAMAFFKRKEATIKVIDRSGGGNVTADAIAKNHRYDLDEGETRRFKVVVKPKSRKRATINVQLCGSPSTLVENKQDCSTCVLKVKN